ncbi:MULTISPECIES: class I SAM-dependent DNA methyltransferase [Carnobacterium]|uniref:Class I SAM-dependent DNA methyltransferase n=1 Tax=Carnobacterium antarcticum TaxID=2126436 RepID=A0ABW4NMQ4_9LACT|nr:MULTISPECIES: class I SAM-dependent methyltransferase [unclassified Carnobacterium]ALV20709.1 Methyltransferase [Carnobacterium sp. CP1]QQP70939.1 class I SAM-dependent methyltransferase [Carnobacterium sp. CS13]
MSYQTFAQVYDAIMDDTLYERWASFVDRQLQNKGQSVLELACGTGALAVTLKKHGYDVTGLDLSANMLSLASERAFSEGVQLPLIEGDMLDLSEIGQYDVVTCFSDSICYMPDAAAVLNVFKEVYQTLNEEGTFLFDVHSIYQIDNIFPGYMYNDQSEEISFLWQSYAGETEHSIEHDLTFFVYEEETDRYERFDETHKERTYPIEVYREMLQQAGFTSIFTSAEFGESDINDESTRWFFTCKK